LPIVADRGDGGLLQSKMLSHVWSSKAFWIPEYWTKKHLILSFFLILYVCMDFRDRPDGLE
jgi:hypothetical protein